MTVSAALARFERTGEPIAGSTDPMSAGNGGLMRLSPVAIRHWSNREALIDAAVRQTATTHGAPEALGASAAFAHLLRNLYALRRKVRPHRLDQDGGIPFPQRIGMGFQPEHIHP